MIKLCKTCDYYINRMCALRLHGTNSGESACKEWLEKGSMEKMSPIDDKIVSIPRTFRNHSKTIKEKEKIPYTQEEINEMLN